METCKISIILFYDKNGNVLIQDRKDFDVKRFGEEYGFFGGKIKKGESPEEALKREIREELNLEVQDYKFFKKYAQEFKEFDKVIERFVFIAPMPDVKNLKVDEGKPFFIQFGESFNLKMMPRDTDILRDICNFLKIDKK
jgi:mutator protein MutT